jgi:hypothetical protein
LVRGVAPGYSSIIASSGKAADTTRIRIVEGVTPAGVNISPDAVVLKWLDATAILTAEVRDDDGTLVAEPGLTRDSPATRVEKPEPGDRTDG